MAVPRCLVATLLGLGISTGAVAEWSGYIAGEARLFPQSELDTRQGGEQFTIAVQPEFYHAWDERRQSFTFVPFARVDSLDSERNHVDIRELTWLYAGRDWELRAGIRKLFWGVTESQHLVDIINQTDLVEDPDGEDKLGQPMFNLALIRDWGTVDLFVLPYFRERTFPGVDGRLRAGPPVDTDQPVYESSREERHVDVAVRWFETFGDWDVGLSHFVGTGRDPRLVPALDGKGRPVLVPHYDQIEQTGLDVQATLGSWLWKLEAISRRDRVERFAALTGGFEYTFTGIAGSRMDLGAIAEYLWDERAARAPTPFQDDVMLGLRLAINDAQSSDLLFGIIRDLDHGSHLFNLEASRRLGDSWKLSVIARAYADVGARDVLYGVRNDDYLQVELARYF